MTLTPKQLAILTFIHRYRQTKGVSPTYAEIATAFKVTPVSIFEHLEALERKGTITRHRHEARSLLLTESGVKCVGAIAAKDPEELLTALDEIANPIKYMKLRLPEGHVLEGANAMALSADPNYLKGIASRAIAKWNGQ